MPSDLVSGMTRQLPVPMSCCGGAAVADPYDDGSPEAFLRRLARPLRRRAGNPTPGGLSAGAAAKRRPRQLVPGSRYLSESVNPAHASAGRSA